MSQAELPFDRIHIGEDKLTVEEFLRLPLHERVQHIVGSSLEFSLQGAPVSRRDALAALRNHWAKSN